MRRRVPRDRYRHCLSVARCAEKLAWRHGVSACKARVAGVLHDVARTWSNAELLDYAATHNILVGDTERAHPVLLHAQIGADIARREFGVEDREILGAIARHTVAVPGMSRLEKVVYEADTFEPGRDYPGRARLEATAMQSLDAGLLACIASSLEYLKARRITPAPETLALYDELVKMYGSTA
ncbi:MAG TPA: bis(5'-nucleosyl)-tetraphosphatase (symmetrical) YqeK [Candidatus Eremiobacteraceae bacterium]|jgi:predicted HD superfamily hydrolase involved in NAD metabolism